MYKPDCATRVSELCTGKYRSLRKYVFDFTLEEFSSVGEEKIIASVDFLDRIMMILFVREYRIGLNPFKTCCDGHDIDRTTVAADLCTEYFEVLSKFFYGATLDMLMSIPEEEIIGSIPKVYHILMYIFIAKYLSCYCK